MELILSYLINIIDKYYHQRLILKELKKLTLKIVFDVGAHKGEFAKSILNINGIKKVYSFEPQKEIFKKYSKILKKNSKIHYVNIGLSDHYGKMKIQINKKTSTSTFSKINISSNWFRMKNLLLSGIKKTSFLRSEYARITTGDKFIKSNKLKNIDLLKIDTEGHEEFVLKGFHENFIKNSIKYLLIEFHNSKMYSEYSPKLIENYLKKKNFILKKKFKFPFLAFEDRLYFNKKY